MNSLMVRCGFLEVMVVRRIVTLNDIIYNARVLTVDVSCPAGWSSNSSYCYYVSANAAIWSTARSNCESMNAHLVSLRDIHENEFVRSIS